MIWLLLFTILALFLVFGLWYSVYLITYRKENKELRDSFLDFLSEKIRLLLISILVGIMLVSILCFKPLYNTVRCSISGTSMNTETSYSWVLGECLYKSKTGAMLPLKVSRDSPEGGSHVEE